MASLNLCQFIGNLGQDPDIRYTTNGDAVANFSIACNKKWKDRETGQEQEHTEWIRCVAFKRRAEVIGEYMRKGSPIYVSGEQRTRKWEDKDGNDRWTTEILVNDFQFLGGKQGDGGQRKADDQAAQYGQGGATYGPPSQTSGANPQTSGAGGGVSGAQGGNNFDDFDDDIPF